jgi:hypothetical protein
MIISIKKISALNGMLPQMELEFQPFSASEHPNEQHTDVSLKVRDAPRHHSQRATCNIHALARTVGATTEAISKKAGDS